MSEPTRLKAIAAGAFLGGPIVVLGELTGLFVSFLLASSLPELTYNLGWSNAPVGTLSSIFLVGTPIAAALLSSFIFESSRKFPMSYCVSAIATGVGAMECYRQLI